MGAVRAGSVGFKARAQHPPPSEITAERIQPMKRSIIVLCLAATTVVMPATSNASVRTCSGNPQGTGYGPRNDRGAPNWVTSVRNMSCRAAGWGAVEHGYLTSSGNLRTSGWHCVVLKRYHIGTSTTGADGRCVRGGKSFRWRWGT